MGSLEPVKREKNSAQPPDKNPVYGPESVQIKRNELRCKKHLTRLYRLNELRNFRNEGGCSLEQHKR